MPIVIVKSIVYCLGTILYCVRIKLFRLLSLFVQTCTYERSSQEKKFAYVLKLNPTLWSYWILLCDQH